MASNPRLLCLVYKIPILGAALSLCGILFLAPFTHAQTIVWADGSKSDAFLDGSSWTGGEVPTNEQYFQVNASEEITVTLGSSYSVQGLVAGASNGEWTLDLGGNTLILLSTATNAARSFHMPHTTNLRTITIENGTLQANNVDFRGSQTTVVVDEDAVFNTQGIAISQGASLEIFGNVTSGATVQTASASSITVDGGEFSVTGNPLYAGTGGLTDESLIHFKNGATVNATLLIAGRDTSASGTGAVGGKGRFLIEGAGTTVETERLFLSGGSRTTAFSNNNPSPEGIGTVQILDGALVETDYLEAYERGTILINGAQLIVGTVAGSRIHEGATLQIGLNSVSQSVALVVNTLDITDSTFELILDEGFAADILDEIFLITYATSLVGEFDGYAEGEVFTIDGFTFQLSYGTRSEGGAVSLTVIPEPRIAAALFGMLAIAVSMLARRRMML